MQEKNLDKIVEIIPSRLYWISDLKPPKGVPNAFYFCVDNDLKYTPFFSDFGPLNISQVVRFVNELEKLLTNEKNSNIVIYHFTSSSQSTQRVNAAFIMGCFMVNLIDYAIRNGLRVSAS